MRRVNQRVLIRCATMASIASLLAGASCSSKRTNTQTAGPYTAQHGTDPARDPGLARKLHASASSVMDSDPEKAESLLRQALDADLYHGPSHNNLGILLLARGELYGAASEFEWARKLMPGHPDPRVNLAMTLEQAGRLEEAINAYDSALAVYDGFLPALQGRARLQIRRGEKDAQTIAALDEIAMRGDPEWREWAKLWRAKLD